MIYPNRFTTYRPAEETDGEVPIIDEEFDQEFGFEYETDDDFAQGYEE